MAFLVNFGFLLNMVSMVMCYGNKYLCLPLTLFPTNTFKTGYIENYKYVKYLISAYTPTSVIRIANKPVSSRMILTAQLKMKLSNDSSNFSI